MKQIKQLTFTRFIASLVIIVYHFAIEREYPVFPFSESSFLFNVFKGGFLGVSYFYVLSGFIMYYNYYHNDKELDKKKYWLSRFSRIYPLHIVALFLMFLDYRYIESKVTFESFLLQLSLLQAWSYKFRNSYNWPAWSLSVEAFFYVAFPFIVLGMKRLKDKVNVFIISLFWVICMVQQWFFPSFLNTLPLLHLNSFLVGILAGLFYRNNYFPNLKNGTLNKVLFLILMGILIVFAYGRPIERTGSGLLAPLFGAIILLVATNSGKVTKFISGKYFLLLGEISYAMYILHWPIWLIMIKYQPVKLGHDVEFYVYLLIVLLLSYLAYTYIEVPMRSFIRKKYVAYNQQKIEAV